MRVVLCFLFALVTAPAWAGWVKVAETVNAVFYIDDTIIRKSTDIRRVWLISDLKQENDSGVMSHRVLQEYDCKEKRYRAASSSDHSRPMAGGQVLLSGGNFPTEWAAIPPDTIAERILNIACAK